MTGAPLFPDFNGVPDIKLFYRMENPIGTQARHGPTSTIMRMDPPPSMWARVSLPHPSVVGPPLCLPIEDIRFLWGAPNIGLAPIAIHLTLNPVPRTDQSKNNRGSIICHETQRVLPRGVLRLNSGDRAKQEADVSPSLIESKNVSSNGPHTPACAHATSLP